METCEIPKRTFQGPASPLQASLQFRLPRQPSPTDGGAGLGGGVAGCPGLPNTQEVGSEEQRASATPGLASAGPTVHSWLSV